MGHFNVNFAKKKKKKNAFFKGYIYTRGIFPILIIMLLNGGKALEIEILMSQNKGEGKKVHPVERN